MSEGTGPIPGSDLPDSLRRGAGPAKPQFSPAVQVLMNFRAAINVAGDAADERYKIAFTESREKAHDGVIEIARQENHCRAKDNSTRWGLIYADPTRRKPRSALVLYSGRGDESSYRCSRRRRASSLG
jgi:hypothetical protein